MTKIPFGLDNGRLVQPDCVSRGLACGCVCPGCGAQLIASHGEKTVKYFRHHSVNDCIGSRESAIHRAAKQILEDQKEIFVPYISAQASLYDRETGINAKAERHIPGQLVVLEDVELEKSLGSIRPDIVATARGKKLYIEIAYTHHCDENKINKLMERGIATLEVDLSFLPEIPTLDELARLVMDDNFNRMWIFNPRQIEL